MNKAFVERLDKAFSGAKMSDVARRLNIPHATVRNYYKTGRLPAPDVLIKIANETGVSLNWLLLGKGEMYAGQVPPIDLGRLIEEKIGAMIDRKLAAAGEPRRDRTPEFDVAAAIRTFDDPHHVMSEWFRHEGRRYPEDFGIAFFRGWESFEIEDKVAAMRDAKHMIDRMLRSS
jgi:AcrR family transcriptional regulator